jgi:hypothetical protein
MTGPSTYAVSRDDVQHLGKQGLLDEKAQGRSGLPLRGVRVRIYIYIYIYGDTESGGDRHLDKLLAHLLFHSNGSGLRRGSCQAWPGMNLNSG